MVKATGEERNSLELLKYTANNKPKSAGKPQSVYKSIIGKEVLVPASEFGIDVPELYYKARVMKKDPSHSRAVVVKFPDDGNLCWLPVDRVSSWLKDMEQLGLSGSTIGEAASMYAAQILADFSRHSTAAAPAAEAVVPRTPSPEPQPSPRVASLSSERSSSRCSTKTGADAGWSDGEQCSEARNSLRVAHPRKPPADANKRTV